MTKKDICKCQQNTDKKIMFTFDDSVFCCMKCNLPIKKEIQREEIVSWHSEYYTIYHLWLLSGAYEEWANIELQNINSKINQIGLKISREEKCYYWLHQDNHEQVDNDKNCPICGSKMEDYENSILLQKVCKKCFIVTT